MPKRSPAVLLALALSLLTARASAQDPADLPPSSSGASALPAGLEQDKPYWHNSGRYRNFLAGTFELGVLSLRSTLSIGHGKPHDSWFGLQAQSGISRAGATEYFGLRGRLSGFDARLGVRYTFPIERRFLPTKESYVREDLETERGNRSRYLMTEAEISAAAPAPGGNLFAVVSGYALFGVPSDAVVFEESLHVVVDPPFLWRARLGYLYHFGWKGALRLGAAGEVIGVPGREALVVRAGPALNVSLTHHLDATGGFMIVAASPDNLGIQGADLVQIGLRYRWASGDRWPEFP